MEHLEVGASTMAGGGLGLFATSDVPRSTVLMRETPAAFAVASDCSDTNCHECLRSPQAKTLMTCAACKYARYCSKTCQKSAWRVHKMECKNMKPSMTVREPNLNGKHEPKQISKNQMISNCPPSVSTATLRTTVAPHTPSHIYVGCAPVSLPTTLQAESRLVSRLVISSFQQQKKGNAGKEDDLEKVLHLEDHTQEFNEDTIQSIRHQTLQVVGLVGEAVAEAVGVEKIVAALAILRTNGFNILDSVTGMRTIGIGCYTLAARTNHSCDPNVSYAVFDGTHLCFRATKEIAAGSEVLIPYINCFQTRDRRRSALSSQYYFECHCNRCSDSAAVDLEGQLACPQTWAVKLENAIEGSDSCDGFAMISEGGNAVCSVCGYVTPDPPSREEDMDNAAMLLGRAQDGCTSREAKQLAQEAFSLFIPYLHASNATLFTVTEYLLDLCLSEGGGVSGGRTKQEVGDKGVWIPTKRDVMRIYAVCLSHQLNPTAACASRALLLGKIEEADSVTLPDLLNALLSYVIAFDLLRITHGDSGPLLSEAMDGAVRVAESINKLGDASATQLPLCEGETVTDRFEWIRSRALRCKLDERLAPTRKGLIRWTKATDVNCVGSMG